MYSKYQNSVYPGALNDEHCVTKFQITACFRVQVFEHLMTGFGDNMFCQTQEPNCQLRALG